MAALENTGLAITSLREPIPDTVDNGSHMARWEEESSVPLVEGRTVANLISSSETSSRREPTI